MSSKPMNNPIEDELDAIRIRIYEQTKHMSPDELAAYVNEKAAQILKPYNIKILSASVSHTTDYAQRC